MKKVLAFIAVLSIAAMFTPKSECALPEGGTISVAKKGKLANDGVCYGSGKQCMYSTQIPSF